MQITWDLKQQRRLRMCFVMLFPASLTCCVQKHSKSPNSRPFPWLSRPNSPKWMDTARFETRIEATSWLKHSFFLRAVTEENWQQLQENQNKKNVYKMYKFKHFYWAKSIFLPLLKLCNLLRISRTNVLFQGLAMTTVAHPLYMKPSDNFLSMAHKTIQIKVMSLLKLHLVYTHLCLMSFSILAVSAPPYYKNLLCECFM